MTQLRRHGAGALLAIALLMIALATLFPSSIRYPDTPQLCIVCGTVGGVDVLLNIALFLPLGVALNLVGLERFQSVLIAALLTMAIEGLQATIIPGRDAALGDVLANLTGALAGFEIARTSRVWTRVSGANARRSALGAGLMWLVIIVTTLLLMRPAEFSGTIVIAPRPSSEFIEPFRGQVVSLRVDGRSVTPDEPTVLGGHAVGPLALDVRLRRESGDSGNGAIVRIATAGTDAEVAMLTWRRDALEYRQRTRSMDLRLRGPTLKVMETKADTLSTSQLITLHAGREGWTLHARIEGGPKGQLTLRASLGWLLLLPFLLPIDRDPVLLSGIWMVLISMPVGFFAGRDAFTSTGSTRQAAALRLTALLATGLWGVPAILGAPLATAGDGVGTLIGVSVGALLSVVGNDAPLA